MSQQAPLKKTAAIRMARQSVPNPVLLPPAQFVVRVPADARYVDSEVVEIVTDNYLDAQRARAYAVARVALALMGLAHVPLQPDEGSTIEQLMDTALQRAVQQGDRAGDDAPTPFWRVLIR